MNIGGMNGGGLEAPQTPYSAVPAYILQVIIAVRTSGPVGMGLRF